MNLKYLGLLFVVLGLVSISLYGTQGLSISGPGGCTFGGVQSLTMSAATYATGSIVSGNGKIGGDCNQVGSTVNWWVIQHGGPGMFANNEILNGVTTITSANTYTVSFSSPTPPSGEIYQSYQLFASECATAATSCSVTSPISGTAASLFTSSNLNVVPPTYTVTISFQNSAGQAVSGVNVNLIQNGQTIASGVSGQSPTIAVFQGIQAGTYEVDYSPTQGAYYSGVSSIAVSSTQQNFVVNMATATVTATNTLTSTSQSQSTTTTIGTTTSIVSGTATVITTTGICTVNCQGAKVVPTTDATPLVIGVVLIAIGGVLFVSKSGKKTGGRT